MEAGASTQQEGSIFAARANSEVSGGMTSSPGPAASRGTMLSRFHMPQLSFGAFLVLVRARYAVTYSD